mgnify:CR=1 FL=1
MVDTDFAWRLTQGLVRIDSSDPGSYEGEIERYIKVLVEAQLERLSHPVLHAVQIAELEVLPGRRNLMITVPGVSDEARLVYICHMDTVTLEMAGTRTRRRSGRPCGTISSMAAAPAT